MDKQRVEIIGRVVAKPEVKKSKDDKSYSKVGVAVNTKDKDKDGKEVEVANFYDALLFGKRAEKSDNLKKGMLVRVEGRLNMRPYISKKGDARVDLTVFADDFHIFDTAVFK